MSSVPVQPSTTGFATMSSSIEFADNYTRWILRTFAPYMGDRLLEIGTGQGNFRKHLPPLERYVSVDLDPQVVARARERDPQGTYLCADVTTPDFVDQMRDIRVDAVLCANVLEHIPDARQATLNMLTVLPTGGHLLLLVPAHQALYTDMDRLAGHLKRYTRGELAALLQGGPCRVKRLEYFNPLGAVGWWVNKFKRHDDLDSGLINGQIRFFDRYGVPLSGLLNPLTRPFFGQSAILVAEKS